MTGTVLKGGTINVSGNIVAESGSTLDVSGTSGVVDEPASAVSGASITGTSTLALTMGSRPDVAWLQPAA